MNAREAYERYLEMIRIKTLLPQPKVKTGRGGRRKRKRRHAGQTKRWIRKGFQ